MDVDRYAPRLLLWIWERAERETDLPVSCADFGILQTIPAGAVSFLIGHLSSRGFLRSHGGHAGALLVVLLAAGAEEARRLQAQREDRATRARYARKAVLRWLQAHADRQPLRISGFLDSAEIFFFGEALTHDEVAATLSYLADAKLITCEGPSFRNAVGSQVTLTRSGEDAERSDLPIDEYLARQHEGPAQHTHIEAETVNIARGDIHHEVNNTFVVNVTLSSAELAELVGQLAPALKLNAKSKSELVRVAKTLARAGEPDSESRHDNQRGLLRRMRELLGAAPDTVGRQLLLEAVKQVLTGVLGA